MIQTDLVESLRTFNINLLERFFKRMSTNSNTNNQEAGTQDANTNNNTNNRRNNANNGGRRNQRRAGRGGQQGVVTPNTSFKGSEPRMNQQIFTVKMDGNPKHDFNKTLNELKGFAAQECESPKLFMPLFGNDPVSPTTTAPTPPNDIDTNRVSYAMHIEDLKDHRRELRSIKDGEVKIFECIMGQCEEPLKAKLKGLDEFEAKENDKDCAWLIKQIKLIHFSFEDKKDPFMNLVDAKNDLSTKYQGRNESLAAFYTKFKNRVEVIEHQGGCIGTDTALVVYILEQDNMPILARKVQEGDDLNANKKNIVNVAKNTARERYLASLFLKVVSRAKYGTLLNDLQNQVTWGQNVMPTTLAGAYDICNNYKGTSTRDTRNQPTSEMGLTFLQQGDLVAGTDGVVHPGILCYGCQKKGHYSDKCPERNGDEAGTQVSGTVNLTVANENSVTREEGVTFGVCCAHADGNLDPNMTLLDNQSTHSIFRTRGKLENIRMCSGGGLTMRSSGGGIFHTKLVGDYRKLGMTVWYSNQAMADILAMCEVEKKFRVTLDSSVESAFIVHCEPLMKFERSDKGLYVHTEQRSTNNSTNLNSNNAYSFAQIERIFTPREMKDAKKAFELYERTTLSPSFFKESLRNNHILNTTCTAIDMARHEYANGKDVANLRGRTTRKKSVIVPHFIPEGIPEELLKKIQNINLCVDIFYFLGRRFMHTICKGIRYVTAEPLQNEDETTLKKALDKVCNIYEGRGFKVAVILGDNQFECLKGKM